MRRRPHILVCALLSLLLGTFAVPSVQPAHAADNGRWAVYPVKSKDKSEGEGTSKDKDKSKAAVRTNFRMKADPGATLRDKVTVSNRSAQTMTFVLYAADAHNTPRDGGFAVRTRQEKQRDVGAWTRLDHKEITLPSRGKKTVGITLRIPGDAEPGDHVGAVLALDKRVAKAKGKVGVGVQQAVGTRIYLQVNGERKPGLSVEDVHFSYDAPFVPGTGDDATVTYTLVNNGNTMLEPQVDLRAKGILGRTSLSSTGKLLPAELLPGQRVLVTHRWTGPPMLDWGDIEVTASDRSGRLVVTGSTSYSSVSWGLILVPVALSAGLAVWLIRRRRRAQTQAQVPAEAEAEAPA